jgi:hypothetical protein
MLFPVPASVKLPKGETACRWVGSKNGTLESLITDVYLFTDSARRTGFDQAWDQARSSSFGTVVPHLGSGAAWVGAALSLYVADGSLGLQVTLEPFPLTLYPDKKAESIVTAIAKLVVARL